MTQSAIYGESWSYIRDNQDRGISERDARELFHITKVEFDPVTREHRERLLRKRPMVLQSRPKPPIPHPEKERFNSTRSGAMEIVSILRPNYVQAKLHGAASLEANPPRPPMPHVPARLKPEERAHDERQAETNRRHALRRDHLIALGKCRKFLLSAKLSLEILDLFGSFEAYEGACK